MVEISKLTLVLVLAVLASLLLLGGCSEKKENAKVDISTPPPLPDETGASSNAQASSPPALPSDQQAAPSGPPLFG